MAAYRHSCSPMYKKSSLKRQQVRVQSEYVSNRVAQEPSPKVLPFRQTTEVNRNDCSVSWSSLSLCTQETGEPPKLESSLFIIACLLQAATKSLTRVLMCLPADSLAWPPPPTHFPPSKSPTFPLRAPCCSQGREQCSCRVKRAFHHLCPLLPKFPKLPFPFVL